MDIPPAQDYCRVSLTRIAMSITLLPVTLIMLSKVRHWIRRHFRPTRTERLRDLSAKLGRNGESAARRHLENAGYEVLCCNYRPPHGIGEIDIVVRSSSGVLCFVEVKTRRIKPGRPMPNPIDAVDFGKRQRLRRSAAAYLRMTSLGSAVRNRFDVMEVWAIGSQPVRLKHWQGAFSGKTASGEYRRFS